MEPDMYATVLDVAAYRASLVAKSFGGQSGPSLDGVTINEQGRDVTRWSSG